MDTAAIIRDSRTYAPARALAEYFGYTVGWDGDARMVSITSSAGGRNNQGGGLGGSAWGADLSGQ